MAKKDSQKKRILLIEDDEMLANLISYKLEKSGYEVLRAETGQEGLDLIFKEKPDVVLLDLVLPVLNGFKVLEELEAKKLIPRLPVIVLSNSGQPVELKRMFEYKVRDYLIKVDLDPDEVVAKVDRVFHPDTEVHLSKKKGKDLSQVEASILIIEDEVVLGDMLEREFHAHNLHVFRAANAAEAKRVLKDTEIDLILLDIVLPDVDGFTFLKDLKETKKTRNIPVFIISNLGQKEEKEKGMQAGAADYIVKAEVLPMEIYKKVVEYINK